MGTVEAIIFMFGPDYSPDLEVCPSPSWPQIRYGANQCGWWWSVRYDLTGPPPWPWWPPVHAWAGIIGCPEANRQDLADWAHACTRRAVGHGWHVLGAAEDLMLRTGGPGHG